MRIDSSAEAQEMIKRHEGFSLKVYTDTQGHSTIGYGHKLKSNEHFDVIVG